MNVYIWNRVENASAHYCTEGGVVVFADSLEEARNLANQKDGCAIREEELPDEIRVCADGATRVFIMPDAGYC